MHRLLLLILVALLSLSPAIDGAEAARKKNSATVKKEKQEAARRVAQTQEQIKANKLKLRSGLNDLERVNSDLSRINAEVGALQRQIEATEAQIQAVADTVAQLAHDVEVLKQSSAKSLREARTHRQNMTAATMILSSESFNQAMKRSGYIKQLDKSRTAKTISLKQNIALLEEKRQRLNALRQQQTASLASLETKLADLDTRQKEMEQLVAQLRKQGKALDSELAERQKKAAQLEKELDRIIAEERAAPQPPKGGASSQKATTAPQPPKGGASSQKATTAPQPAAPQAAKGGASSATATPPLGGGGASTSFAQSKGRLPFPVSGKYTIVGRFGRNKYEGLSKVEVENSGIDVEVPQGTNALAVHPGTVSSIFKIDGYHNIVMVRHGEYLTVYANIDKLLVKKGDEVASGQAIGKIYSDPDDNNRAVLHFEVRKEREKLNPLEWVRE